MDEPIKTPEGGENPSQPGEPQNKKPEVLDPKFQELEAQKTHWREKAEKAEAELLKFKPAEPVKPVDNEKVGVDPFEAVRLGKALKDYDEAETDFIIRNAKSKNVNDIIAAEKDEMVQLAIKSRREKVAKESKIPSPSAPGGGTYAGAKTPLEISKMTRDEHIVYEQEILEAENNKGGI